MSMCNRVGFRWKVVGEMSGWLCSSVVECSHGSERPCVRAPVEPQLFTCYICTSLLFTSIICLALSKCLHVHSMCNHNTCITHVSINTVYVHTATRSAKGCPTVPVPQMGSRVSASQFQTCTIWTHRYGGNQSETNR